MSSKVEVVKRFKIMLNVLSYMWVIYLWIAWSCFHFISIQSVSSITPSVDGSVCSDTYSSSYSSSSLYSSPFLLFHPSFFPSFFTLNVHPSSVLALPHHSMILSLNTSCDVMHCSTPPSVHLSPFLSVFSSVCIFLKHPTCFCLYPHSE